MEAKPPVAAAAAAAGDGGVKAEEKTKMNALLARAALEMGLTSPSIDKSLGSLSLSSESGMSKSPLTPVSVVPSSALSLSIAKTQRDSASSSLASPVVPVPGKLAMSSVSTASSSLLLPPSSAPSSMTLTLESALLFELLNDHFLLLGGRYSTAVAAPSVVVRNGKSTKSAPAGAAAAASWWDKIKRYFNYDSGSLQQKDINVYRPNIPKILNIKELERLADITRRRYDPDSVGDVLHALEDLNFTNDEMLIRNFDRDNIAAVGFQDRLHERLKEFLRTPFGLVALTIVAAVFPFSQNLNDLEKSGRLQTIVYHAYDEVLSMASADGQLYRAMVRTIERNRLLRRGPMLLRVGSQEDASRDMESFYDMKLNQDVYSPERDGFFFLDEEQDIKAARARKEDHLLSGSCPLFTKYGSPQLLGGGGYGFVLKYTKLDSTSDPQKSLTTTPAMHFAVKFQRVKVSRLRDAQLAAYTELRLMYEIQKYSAHWSAARRLLPFHHVQIYDWVRCKFNPRVRFRDLLSKMSKDSHGSVFSDMNQNQQDVFQIIVEEYIEQGSLESCIQRERFQWSANSTSRCTSLLIQVFAHLHQLGKLGRISHKDMKPDNVLVTKLKPPSMGGKIEYLVYHGTPRGTLYVPLEDSNGEVYKISDYGRGRGEVLQQSGKKPSLVVIGSDGAAFNPAHDVESFMIMMLRSLLRNLKNDVRYHVPSVLLELALLTLHPSRDRIHQAAAKHIKSVARLRELIPDAFELHPIGDVKRTAEMISANYGALEKCLQDLTDKSAPDMTEAQIFNIRTVIIELYHKGLPIWEDTPTAQDLGMFDTLFRHAAFSRYTKRPRDLTDENSMDMTDYRPPEIPPDAYTPVKTFKNKQPAPSAPERSVTSNGDTSDDSKSIDIVNTPDSSKLVKRFPVGQRVTRNMAREAAQEKARAKQNKHHRDAVVTQGKDASSSDKRSPSY